jgi:hypothetical protein
MVKATRLRLLPVSELVAKAKFYILLMNFDTRLW